MRAASGLRAASRPRAPPATRARTAAAPGAVSTSRTHTTRTHPSAQEHAPHTAATAAAGTLLARGRAGPAAWRAPLAGRGIAGLGSGRAPPPQRHTQVGRTTATTTEDGEQEPGLYLATGYALFAKRRSRPFPPPFLSLPSGSFSEPLSTHDRSTDRRPHVGGEPIRGVTNGDDAVVAEPHFVGASDGVGQWATRPRGHAALWSRLILHFWARGAEAALAAGGEPDPVAFLQAAYEATCEATRAPAEWHGTTTACSALLRDDGDGDDAALHVTNLGDSQVLVLRPATRAVLFKTAEQWHWFDCPRQLGTNSPDTPRANAVCERVAVQEGDVVLAMSDGVPDNLWEHEITDNVFASLAMGKDEPEVAEELVRATRTVAEDPFAESPYMERAIEEGLAIEGGKMDDISVVIGVCRRRPA